MVFSEYFSKLTYIRGRGVIAHFRNLSTTATIVELIMEETAASKIFRPLSK